MKLSKKLLKARKKLALDGQVEKKDEDYIEYEIKRAIVRKLSRESNTEIWEQFVK
jgi:hypothetical protein